MNTPRWSSARAPRAKSQSWPDCAGRTIGVITRIGEAHLGGFGSQQQLAGSESRIARRSARRWRRGAQRRRSVAYAKWPIERLREWFGSAAEATAIWPQSNVRLGDGRFVVSSWRTAVYRVPVWGRHHLIGALAAIAVGQEFGMTPAEIAAALADFEPPPCVAR